MSASIMLLIWLCAFTTIEALVYLTLCIHKRRWVTLREWLRRYLGTAWLVEFTGHEKLAFWWDGTFTNRHGRQIPNFTADACAAKHYLTRAQAAKAMRSMLTANPIIQSEPQLFRVTEHQWLATLKPKVTP